MTKRLHIICLSSSVDRYVSIDSFSMGSAIRARGVIDFASGKGVNSACSLKVLGLRHSILTLFGSAQAELFTALGDAFCDLHGFSVDGSGRQNVTVVDSRSRLVCHIQMPPYELDGQHAQKVHDYLNSQISREDMVLLSGSLPLGLDANFYDKTVDSLKAQQVTIFADLDPDYYSINTIPKIDVLRINADEASRLYGTRIEHPEQIQSLVLNQNFRPALLIVSFGHLGAVAIDSNNEGYWGKYGGDPLEFDATGSGDAMSGVMAHAISRDSPMADVLRMGIAAGTANVLTRGPGRFKMSDYQFALSKVDVERLF